MSTEILDQLKDDAQQFLESFGKDYLKMFGAAMLEKIAAELEAEGSDAKKLKYRDWDSIQRSELFHGFCYMKTGVGVGSFKNWKKVYLVEQQDYNIAVYKTDKDAQANKKPEIIKTCGMTLVEDPTYHYKREAAVLTGGMGLEESALPVSFSRWAWALAHPVRTNYIFQLHPGKDPKGCLCLGGTAAIEPDDLGAENEKEREQWIAFMEKCVHKAEARDTSTAAGLGFDKTVGKMTAALERLNSYSDNGTEAQMLVSMLYYQCFEPLKQQIFDSLPNMAAVKIKAWYTARESAVTILDKAVTPAWAGMQTGAEKAGEKIEPVIKKGVTPIYEAKNKVKDKIREGVSSKLGEALGKHVTPFLKPVFKAFEKPLEEAFNSAKDVFSAKVSEAAGQLPSDLAQCNRQLDAIPRTGSNVHGLRHHCSELVEPLRKLVDLSSEVFGDLDPSGLRIQAEDLVLQTLDAAIYSLELEIEKQGTGNVEGLKANLLPDFDHDVVIQKATFMKQVMRNLLIPPLMRLVEAVTSPIVDACNSVIPEDMQDFLNVAAIFEELVDLLVGEPVDQMVDAAYPTPCKDARTVQAVKSVQPEDEDTEM